jgi:hypothetical protein
MARVTYVKKARGRSDGRPRRCFKCSKVINPGDPYKWFANRIGRMSQRKDCCSTCQIRPSDQTTSPHLQTIYSAQEAAEDALSAFTGRDTLDSLGAILRDCAESYREAQESYAESADNIEEGFGHETSMSEEIREKAEACETAADEIEGEADEIEGMDDPDVEDAEFADEFEYAGETDDDDKPIDAEDYTNQLHDFAEEKREERWEEASQRAQDAVNEGVQV